MTTFLLIPIWFLAGYAAISIIEHHVHRYHMHRRGPFDKIQPWVFRDHVKTHHAGYRHDFEHCDPESDAEKNLELGTVFDLILFSPAILLAAYFSISGAVVLILMTIAHALTWNAIHREMHLPSGIFFSEWPAYRYLRQYHLDHHLHPGTNFNVVCPGADWLFGTLYREKA